MPSEGGRARAGAAVLGVLGVLLGGCILFVSSPPYGSSCRFAGEQSACGACVTTRCQDAVNACCTVDACASTLRDLEGCASKHDETCTTLASAARSDGPTSTDLRACVASRCAGECQPLQGVSETSCHELALAAGAACSCVTSAAAGPNDFTCSRAVFPSARCCTPKGWPAAGLECSCKRAQCNPTADGCFCSLVDYTPDQEACGGTPGLFCCASAKDAQCTCRSHACFAGEELVPSCSADVIGCGVQDTVDSCSRRTP